MAANELHLSMDLHFVFGCVFCTFGDSFLFVVTMMIMMITTRALLKADVCDRAFVVHLCDLYLPRCAAGVELCRRHVHICSNSDAFKCMIAMPVFDWLRAIAFEHLHALHCIARETLLVIVNIWRRWQLCAKIS